MIPIKPFLITRLPLSYAAVRERLQREDLGKAVPDLFAEVAAWLALNEIEIVGSPFIRYLGINYNSGEVEVHIGFPTSVHQIPAHHRIEAGELPGGVYATTIHQGAYMDLVNTTAMLLEWGRENDISWRVSETGGLTDWIGRVEHYLVGPPDELSPENWRTEVAILIST
jgi:effector-binding domain-containing protein